MSEPAAARLPRFELLLQPQERRDVSLPPAPVRFQRVTFRRGTIEAARFAPDGQAIVYGAAWGGSPVEVFSTLPESTESRPLGFPGTELLAISSRGEMALSIRRRRVATLESSGILAKAPLAGGAARELLEDVSYADWAPDGSHLAVVRRVAGRDRLEFPVGRVLYETVGRISSPRVAASGDAVALIDHPTRIYSGGSIVVVDSAGRKRTLAKWLVASPGARVVSARR